MLNDRKLGEWVQPVSSLADKPQMSAAALKAAFDGNTNQVKPALNGLIDDLQAAEAAGQLGFAVTAGVQADTVQAAIEDVQRQVVDTALGEVPDGSIGTVKLADEVQTQIAQAHEHITDTNAHAEKFEAVNAKIQQVNPVSAARIGDIVTTTDTIDDTFVPCSGQVLIKTADTKDIGDKLGFRYGVDIDRSALSVESATGDDQANTKYPGTIVATKNKIIHIKPYTTSSGTMTTARRTVYNRSTLVKEVDHVATPLLGSLTGLGYQGGCASYNETIFISSGKTIQSSGDYGVTAQTVWTVSEIAYVISTPFGVIAHRTNGTTGLETRLYTSPTSYTVLPTLSSGGEYVAYGDRTLVNGFSFIVSNGSIYRFNGSAFTIVLSSINAKGMCATSNGLLIVFTVNQVIKYKVESNGSLTELMRVQVDLGGYSINFALPLPDETERSMAVLIGNTNNSAASSYGYITLDIESMGMSNLKGAGTYSSTPIMATSDFGAIGVGSGNGGTNKTSWIGYAPRVSNCVLPNMNTNGTVFYLKSFANGEEE